ncbi:ovarian-specific serine/threonine-protein kinase Lok-like [Daphnia pulicaria]|uniref:ovarian-specific serine/threonine-protein kinase Lok-like n=1 Tax=Daphnia pulicaria TaxID=35523 RepID=UPI001EEAADAD|nr:ovarian-specific serine/threonine-protein kinase Lok-like [Daphnia pulicaria]
MSTSTVSNPESATSSINGNRTPWGWLVWNDPKWKVGFALGTTEIGNVATIGRGLFCTVSVQPTLVENALFERISRQHCTLEKSMEDGKVTIVNNSQNGTFVNGERVNYLRTRPINHGSVVALCYAGSPASFTFYDNYHRFSDVNFVLNNRYVVMDVLAKGSFGQVCRAIRKHDHTIVAVKTVTPATLGGTFTTTSVGPGGLEALRNEIQILSTTDHPCIIKMVDSSSDVTTSKMFLALELANGGDLQQRLHDVGYLSEPVSRFVFVQLVSAIKYCHGRSPPIVHRDLNPANILLVNADEFARVKIAAKSSATESRFMLKMNASTYNSD